MDKSDPAQPRIFLHNADVITMDDERRRFTDGAVLIEGDRIVEVGSSKDVLARLEGPVDRVDLRGRILFPGMVNTHVHTSQHLGRGLGDDVDLLTWLHDRIWPYESSLTEEDSYVSSLLCGLEMIRSGVTCLVEPGGQHVDGMGRALSELGIRGVLARSTMDGGEGLPDEMQETTEEVLDVQTELLEHWHGAAGDRIRFWYSLRTIFNNSDELILRSKELADEHGVGVNMHVAEVKEEVEYVKEERGARTVTHLNDLGVLDENFLAVHCVWMNEDEIRMFADHDVKVSHNPAAALRVLGLPKITEMVAEGVCVGLGTDGAPSNNRMTLIDEMWLATLLQKGRNLDPTALPAETVLEMVSRNGARSILWDDELGSLEPGKKADLVVIDPDSCGMLPLHDTVGSLVNAMRSQNVEDVMVDGEWVMVNGDIVSVNEEEILQEAQARAQHIVQRANIDLPERFPIYQ